MKTHLLTHPWVIGLRNRTRHNPIARALYQRWMAAQDYEERFAHRLLSAADASTVVWDIGANVGLYVAQLLQRGARHVVAFEPAPEAVAALRGRFGASSPHSERVTIVPIALSDTAGKALFSAKGADVTNRLVRAGTHSIDTIEIGVDRADEILQTLRLPPPNLVKIDVEGFELEVLRGFGKLLRENELRGVFVEVHFSQLHQRGRDSAPAEIDALLTTNGFSVEWLDLSHLCGVRGR